MVKRRYKLTKKLSEGLFFGDEPKVSLKKMTKYSKEIFNKFSSIFSSDMGKFCTNIVNDAFKSSSPDKVLSTAITANYKKKDSNYLSSWLETAKFVYDYSRKLKKSTSYCVLAYMLAIACCAFQIPARFLYPFANGEEFNVQKKDIWVKYLSETDSFTLLFNFILYVYVLCITPRIITSILSGEFLPILLLVVFNILFHYKDEIFPEKTESYVNRLSLEWL